MSAEPITAAPGPAAASAPPGGARVPPVGKVGATADPPGNRRRDLLIAAALLLPNLVLLVVFTYRPLLDNIRLSFTSWNISSPTATYIGIDNYVDWFTSADSRQVIWNTVVFTGSGQGSRL